MDEASADRRGTAERAKSNRPSVSTIIPVWNEAPAIEMAVERTRDFLVANFDDFEILIVESGSTDGSIEICDQLAERWPEVEVIHQGAAEGFDSAGREINERFNRLSEREYRQLGKKYDGRDLVVYRRPELNLPRVYNYERWTVYELNPAGDPGGEH